MQLLADRLHHSDYICRGFSSPGWGPWKWGGAGKKWAIIANIVTLGGFIAITVKELSAGYSTPLHSPPPLRRIVQIPDTYQTVSARFGSGGGWVGVHGEWIWR